MNRIRNDEVCDATGDAMKNQSRVNNYLKRLYEKIPG